MLKSDIVIMLFTIIYGLMLTDLFFSFHKLIRSRKIVKWHWLPTLTVWYLFLIILKNWWDLTSMQIETDWINIWFFIAYGHLLVLIFLAVSTALPDDVPEKGINLKDYYFNNHKYFWGLISLIIFISLSISVAKETHTFETFTVANVLGNSIYIVLTLILALVKRYWIHSVIIILLVAQIVLEIITKS